MPLSPYSCFLDSSHDGLLPPYCQLKAWFLRKLKFYLQLSERMKLTLVYFICLGGLGLVTPVGVGD